MTTYEPTTNPVYSPLPPIAPLKLQTSGGQVAHIFQFVDILGCDLHTINDPEDQLPIPATLQIITIGPSRMRVESVTLSSINPTVYTVRVRSVPSVRQNHVL